MKLVNSIKTVAIKSDGLIMQVKNKPHDNLFSFLQRKGDSFLVKIFIAASLLFVSADRLQAQCSFTSIIGVVTTNVSCKGDSSGSLDIVFIAGGGGAPYTFYWKNISGDTLAVNDSTLGNLQGGAYIFVIYDKNGCKDSNTYNVNEPATIFVASISSTPPTCAGLCTGTATALGAGGTPPYSYTWNTVPPQITSIATGLCQGTYTVTASDNNGCDTVMTVTITDPTAISVGVTKTDVSCKTGNDGTATASPSGGTSPYTYLWSPSGGTGSVATGLTAGTFTVTVTDLNGCTTTATVTLTEPPTALSVSATKTDILCSGGNTGTATATPIGGSTPYTYLWSPSGGTGSIATGLTAGTYTVTVTDNKGCTSTQTVTISQPPVLTAATSKTDITCNGNNDGTATVTPGGGTSPYTYAWSPGGAATPSISNLSAGTYTVTVSDNNGCTQTATAVITESPPITIGTSQANVTCNGGNNGSATASPSGGTTPYTYLWSPSGGTGSTATGLTAGTYTVTITDAGGCSKTATVVITQPAIPLTAPVTSVNVSCNGGNNGSATVSPTGGTTPYTYSWSPSGGTGSTATGLTAGTYTVTVIDAVACTKTTTVIISQPPLVLSIAISKTDVNCNSGNSGTATATPSGGTSPYTYLWSSGQSTQVITGLTSGTYTVTVTDLNSCTNTATVTITQSPPLTATQNGTSDLTCNGICDGAADVSASGGASPYTYTWSTIPVQNGQTATGLCAGTYTITVTDKFGCTATDTAVINEPPALTIPVTKNDAACGVNNGSATVTPSGGTSGYIYSWTTIPAQTTAIATGLSAGTYTVTVTDANGCTMTATTTIIGLGSHTVTLNGTSDASCSNICDGAADISASGGTPPYTYAWNTIPVQTGQTATGLCGGTYTVTVTDNNGCGATATAVINAPPAIIPNLTSSDITCNGNNDGTATTTPSGGVTAYNYLWNTVPAQTTASISNLSGGNYTVTITDGNGCTQTAAVTITDPAPVVIAVNGTSDLTCNASCDGAADISPSGGTGAYTYQWNTIPPQTTQTATGLCSGTFTVTVTDINGCSSTTSVTINEPAILTPGTTKTDAACGSNNGTATSTPAGGTSGYNYQWSTVPIQTTASITGLSVGIYTVTVTDNNGCTVTSSVTINNIGGPAVTITSTVDASCNSFCDGSATSSVSSGTSPFTYSWSSIPPQTSANATGLCAGVYSLTVTDAIGCISIITDTIDEPTAINIVTTTTPVNCASGSDGTATATPSGGASGYIYSWNTGPATPSISGLTAGTYTVTVTDSKGCSNTATVVVAQTAPLTVSNGGTSDATCFNLCDGAADASPSGGTSPYTYSWNTVPAQTTQTATGLCSGTFTVTVTDQKGCTATLTVVINQPTAMSLPTTKSDAVCGSSNGTATVTPSGGTPGYIYSWTTVPVQTTQSVTGLSGGIYTVTVTDNNGCTATALAAIASIGGATIVVNGQNDATCNGICDGAADVSGTGGIAPYTFSWNTTPPQTGVTATGLCAGDVLVTITDANGCVSVDTVTILSPTAIIPSVSDTDITCNGSCNGISTVNPSGGTPGYNYLWSTLPPQSTQTISGLCQGTYTVTVTDNNGCTATATSVIAEPAVLAVNPSGTTDATCNSVCDGDADVSAVGGTSPYTYQWNTVPVQTSQTATGLCAGTYTVTVTDSRGCTATLTAQINEPTAILVPTTKSDANCNQADGSATVTPSGGSPGYNYNWSTVPAQTTSTAINLSVGIYTVTVTDNNSCTQTTTVVINNINGPVPSVSGTTDATCNALCNGSATASATGGSTPYTFSWDGGPPQSNPVVTGLCAGTHTVTITDKNGCVGITTTLIAEPALLSNVMSKVNTLCDGSCDGSATATTAGGTSPYTYLWNSVPPQGTSIATGLCTGPFTVTITDANGCTMTDTISIFSPPPITITKASTPVSCLTNCDGTATVTPFGGAVPYTYSWNTIPSQTTPVATALCLQTYTITITDVNSCTFIDTIKITALDLLVVTVDDDTLCRGDSTTLRASGAGTYTWAISTDPTNTIAVGDTFRVAPLITTTYIVTGINGACASADSVTITVNPRPQLIITGPSSVLCKGDSALLTVTGAHTYLWSNSLTDDSMWVKPIITTVYSVTGTDTITGCDTTASFLVIVDSVSIIVRPDTICQGDSSLLSVSGADAYSWALVDSPWTVLSTNDTLLVKPGITTCYQLTATNLTTGCIKIDTVCVVVMIPVADAGADIISCFGDSVYLNGAIVDASGGYWWTTTGGGSFFPDSTAINGVYLPAASDTIFDLMFTTTGLCKADTDTVTVMVRQNPTVYAGPDKYIVLGATVKLNGFVTNSPGIKWTTSGSGKFTPSDSILNPTYVPSDADYENGIIYLILTTVGACKTVNDTMIVTVTEIKAPNVFTPDGDGLNDRFIINGAPEESRLVIFNRWGLKVFESNNYLNDWDGEGVNTDVYYYVLTYKTRSWNGWVKVIKKE